MHLDHINIAAPAELLAKTRDFYCDVIGLAEGFRPMFSREGFWLYTEGKPIIHLIESLEHSQNEKKGYFDHFALQATGLEKVIEKLDESDTPYRVSYLPEIELSQIFCKDPCGIGVEINFPGESV